MAHAEYDHQELATCSSVLQGLQQRSTDIMELAADANPDWHIWGLVGVLPAKWYWQYASDLYEHLGMIGEALRDHTERIDCAADNYRAVENGITEAMTQIESLLT